MFNEPQHQDHSTFSNLAVYLPAAIMIVVGISLFAGMLASALIS